MAVELKANIGCTGAADCSRTLNLDARPAHFRQAQLALRWRISPRTLERWRWVKAGPSYIKLGGRVVYRLEDIEAYEREALRVPIR